MDGVPFQYHYEYQNCEFQSSVLEESNKVNTLHTFHVVRHFFQENPQIKEVITSLDEPEEYALLALIAAGQGNQLLYGWNYHQQAIAPLKQFAKQLLELDHFYEPIGGMIGYHALFIQLLRQNNERIDEGCIYSKPEGINLAEESDERRTLALEALRHLGDTALILPIGGAGDRLMLRNPLTGEPLPSACLHFSGHNLLEGIMRDLQAQEYLHFKLFGAQVKSTIVMMTSFEKNNHQYIQEICEENEWFSRSREKFLFAIQPSVPMLTPEGNWVFSGPLNLLLKPSGHGVLWKIMEDQGVFDRLEAAGIKKAMVRQINNPLAAVDDGLLAFAGKGWSGGHIFGFASSKRQVNIPAGVLVLKEKETSKGYECQLTNVEYTDFKRYGIEDIPESSDSSFSKYALNTNILFADLSAVRRAALKRPFPGLLINIKSDVPSMDEQGEIRSVPAGRIETTMQNIADEFTFRSPKKEELTHLPVYATFHNLGKLFSAVKKPYEAGKSAEGTPENAFYDCQLTAGDLFRNDCGFAVPELGTFADTVNQAPGYVIRYHPSLGPCYSIIAQKIKGGSMAKGSELVLEIAELNMRDVALEGSLRILCDDPMGLENEELSYSHAGGKCELHHVRVVNAGVDYAGSGPLWTGKTLHQETLEIIVHGNGEFCAENVTFVGSHRFEVAPGMRMTVKEEKGKLRVDTRPISAPTWYWKHEIGPDDRMVVRKC